MKANPLSVSRALSILLAVFLIAGVARAQITLQLGGGAGIALPASDYGGSTIDYYNGVKYGLSNGFNVHGKARVGVLGFQLTGEVNYSSFSNSGDAEPGQGSVDISQKVLAFRLGPEFHIWLPAMPVTPYIGANVALNRFSGQVKFQGVSRVSSGTYDLHSATRFGYGFSGGVIVTLGALMSLDLGVSYNYMNASSKTWEDVNPTVDQRLDSYLALNDTRDPLFRPGDDKHFIGTVRKANSVEAKATIMFGL
jgi:opacity protein-like surface antigen